MDNVTRSLYTKLHQTHETLLAVDRELQEIEDRYEIAGRKYAEIRDMLHIRLGCSPYAPGATGDPEQDDGEWDAETLRLRLIRKPIAEAVTMILEEAGEPLNVQQIIAELSWGGFEFPDNQAPARVVNAAVVQRKNLQKTTDGRYYLPDSYAAMAIHNEEEGLEPEDLPF